jgi:hypothetical protein
MRNAQLDLPSVDAPASQRPGAREHHREPSSVDETAFLAEISRRNEEATGRRVMAVRRAALDQLREEYGDAPIPERVARARGVGRPRYTESRRSHARREAVRAAAVELAKSGLEFTFADLARAIGDHTAAGPKRVRHAVTQLVRARRWPEGVALGRREIGGRGA